MAITYHFSNLIKCLSTDTKPSKWKGYRLIETDTNKEYYPNADETDWVLLLSGGSGGGEAFPVGSVFIAIVSTNPNTLLGYGTWGAFGAGKVLVGLDSGDADFDVVEETGGAKTHTLAVAQMPSHQHDQTVNSATTGTVTSATKDTSATAGGASANKTSLVGGGEAHNNLQPYIVVYMWKRTA